jgi:hypothetical protein
MAREITATTRIRVVPGRVTKVLLDSPGTAVADDVSREQQHDRTFVTALSVYLGRGASLSQGVEIHLGPPHRDGGLVLPVTWRPIGHARLCPSFAGELRASSDHVGTAVTVSGAYDPPLGLLGRLYDVLIGRWLARASLQGFVDAIGRRLDAQVDASITAGHVAGAAGGRAR